jgi:hypothetical protein
MLTLDEILKDSIIIAAHPDDEVLWYSSILDKVDHIKICFLKSESYPIWSKGRIKAIAEYPLSNISGLDIDEAEVFNDKNWTSTELTKFGIAIKPNGFSKLLGMRYIRNYFKYIRNYHKLKNRLKKTLNQYRNVITHNPWGEYGHEEHVQVYRVVKELKKEYNFNLWFNNYSSNKSYKLMSYYLNLLTPEFISLNTNKNIAKIIMDLYIKNQCWTWYDEWQWADNETIIKENFSNSKNDKFGKTIPINFINVRIDNEALYHKRNKRNVKFIIKKFLNLIHRFHGLS